MLSATDRGGSMFSDRTLTVIRVVAALAAMVAVIVGWLTDRNLYLVAAAGFAVSLAASYARPKPHR